MVSERTYVEAAATSQLDVAYPINDERSFGVISELQDSTNFTSTARLANSVRRHRPGHRRDHGAEHRLLRGPRSAHRLDPCRRPRRPVLHLAIDAPLEGGDCASHGASNQCVRCMCAWSAGVSGLLAGFDARDAEGLPPPSSQQMHPRRARGVRSWLAGCAPCQPDAMPKHSVRSQAAIFQAEPSSLARTEMHPCTMVNKTYIDT